MDKQELLKQFPKQEEKLLVSKILDKLKFMHTKNQVQVTEFLDAYQQNTVSKVLKASNETNYILSGGYEEAQRKMLFIYPEKIEEIFSKENENNPVIMQNIKVISITLPQELQGKYNHSEYLGGIMKLGIKREIIGDIIVNEAGADIIVQNEMAEYLKTHLQDLTRSKKEEIVILIPQMRLDVVVSEILHLSRSKANEIIAQERVFINYELKTKNATTLKENDILTIRGKGKFEIGQILSTTSKGKIRLSVRKYV